MLPSIMELKMTESMSKDELKAALNQKGYKYTSMKNFKGSFNNESI